MNWRPIKTAPKDEMILLCYPSFINEQENIVSMGRWVKYPHTNLITKALSALKDPSDLPVTPHWEIAYVAILQHGGGWNGYSFEARGNEVEPTHWMPLPKPR